MGKSTALIRIKPDHDLDAWATRITTALQKTVEGIFETGRQLLAAREKLPHGEWTRLFSEHRVPMSVHSARMFIEIYKRRDLLMPNRDHGSGLPPSWRTLYELARLPDDTLAWAHDHGKITPDIERKQIKGLCAEYDGDQTVQIPKQRSVSTVGAHTPGSDLVTYIQRQLTHKIDGLTTDDQRYVVAILRQILDDIERAIDGHHA